MADGDQLTIGKENDSKRTTGLHQKGPRIESGSRAEPTGPCLRVQSEIDDGLHVFASRVDDSGRSDESNMGFGIRVNTFLKPAIEADNDSTHLDSSEFDMAFEIEDHPWYANVHDECIRGTGKRAIVGRALAATDGVGVFGSALLGNGIEGRSHQETGVHGYSHSATGVSGHTGWVRTRIHVPSRDPRSSRNVIDISGDPGRGVAGYAIDGIAVHGWSEAGVAGYFDGALICVNGPKSAAVPHPDGTHRLFYSLESPEPWFEDFGRARLRNGRARVSLEREFAKLVNTKEYFVFLTSEGDCEGLYVSVRNRSGFEVRESRGGRGSVRFSYRIVAHRRDLGAIRLQRIKLPKPRRPISLKQQGRRKKLVPRKGTQFRRRGQ